MPIVRPLMAFAIALLLASCGGAEQTATGNGAPAEKSPGAEEAPAEESPAAAEPTGDEAVVTDVVNTYFISLGSGDYGTACNQLSFEAQQQVIDLAKSFGQSAENCEEGLVVGLADISKAEQAALGNITVTSVQITGDSATVAVKGARKDVPLTRQGENWVISQLVAG